MNDNDFYAALGASIDGRGNVASGASMYGAREYANRRGSQQVREQIASGGGASRAAGPGVFDDAGEFAGEWTDNTVEFISSAFTWVPNWVGLAFRLISIIAFLAGGVHYGFTGFTLIAIAASGWLAPKAIKGTLQLSLCLTLSVAYLCFVALMSVVIIGGLLGIFWGIAQVISS